MIRNKHDLTQECCIINNDSIYVQMKLLIYKSFFSCIANYPTTHPVSNTSCNSISKEQFRMASAFPGDLKKLKKKDLGQ